MERNGSSMQKVIIFSAEENGCLNISLIRNQVTECVMRKYHHWLEKNAGTNLTVDDIQVDNSTIPFNEYILIKCVIVVKYRRYAVN
jgi:hypothetical protein